MKRFGFPLARHLRSVHDFERVYGQKQRVSDRHLLVFGAKNLIGTTRIGLSVSKKHGNAVVRHRLRRLLREAYRLSQAEIPEGFDLILIPREASGATVADYQRSLVSLANKLAVR